MYYLRVLILAQMCDFEIFTHICEQAMCTMVNVRAYARYLGLKRLLMKEKFSFSFS